MEPDFGGYATKAGLRCSDGRVIKASAFQHMDGKKVPLVYQHGHKDPSNVLGHMLLEAREDGVYARGYFNESPNGQNAKIAVVHGDLDSLSIYANRLQEINKVVSHGNITEVSLVLSGANPGAKIDQVRVQHGSDLDDYTELEDEAIIHTGDTLDVPEDEDDSDEDNMTESDKVVEHAADGATIQDVYDTMTDDQKTVTQFMIGAALAEATGSGDGTAEHSDSTEEGIAHQEGNDSMSRNLFENAGVAGEAQGPTLSHEAQKAIFVRAAQRGSLKEAVTEFLHSDEDSLAHGVTNIEILFPDAKNITGAPELDKRRTEWVANVLSGTRHTPFSRIKTFAADLTQDEARAKGYIKGNFKLEEWFGVTQRTTTPTTVYKKQKLDRDDMLDITDFDMVAFLKSEMRLMTEEEIARAILIGDGRSIGAEDKVKDPMGASSGAGIRSILNDHEYYATTLYVNVDDANSSYEEVIDRVMDGQEYLKGTGTPTFYTTIPQLNMFMKAKDLNGRRYYETKAAVAAALGVTDIVTVEVMKTIPGLIGIIVNLDDYNVGTDQGGELTMFDDFDIDYNQQKYLLETRLSGALVRPKSALILRTTVSTNLLAVPSKPTFVPATGVVTIPTVTGVVYKAPDGTTTLTAGAQTAIAAGTTETLYAVPASGYYFADTVNDSWSFTRPAA